MNNFTYYVKLCVRIFFLNYPLGKLPLSIQSNLPDGICRDLLKQLRFIGVASTSRQAKRGSSDYYWYDCN